MNVLYCKRHKQIAQVAWACPESDGFCNAVPMRLIPDNAETVERIADVIYASGWGLRSDARERAVKVLAVLDRETP